LVEEVLLVEDLSGGTASSLARPGATRLGLVLPRDFLVELIPVPFMLFRWGLVSLFLLFESMEDLFFFMWFIVLSISDLVPLFLLVEDLSGGTASSFARPGVTRLDLVLPRDFLVELIPVPFVLFRRGLVSSFLLFESMEDACLFFFMWFVVLSIFDLAPS